MGWFTHLEPPRHIVEGRQFALDNAKDINNYVIALLEKYDYEILPYRPFAVTNVIRYTEKGDPAGALLLAERFRDYLQKTTDRLLVNENSSSLLNDLDERDKKRFINRLIERKNEMANYVMAHKNGNKIFIQIDDILDQSVEKTIASMEQSNNNANNLNSPQETNQEKTLLTGTTKPKTNTNIFIYVIITASMLIILSLIIRRACRKQPPTSQPLAQRAKLCKKQQERCF
jgi:hypothetical protein